MFYSSCRSHIGTSPFLFLERADATRESNHEWRLEVFSAIVAVICRMCASSSREVRVLAYEPLMVLHNSLNSISAVTLKMEELAVQSICEVCRSLYIA